MYQRTITAELRGWSREGLKLVSGLIHDDTRGIYPDYTPVKIVADKWVIGHDHFLAGCEDMFGDQWFLLKKSEEVKD